jgi:F-type H+-transporting ATPase subunit b
MFEVNATLVIFAFFFLVFIYLLNEIVLKPVGQTIERRKAIIQEDYDSARGYSGEGETVIRSYQERLHEARGEAQKIIHDSVASAQRKRDEELHRVRDQGNSKIEQVKADLLKERTNLIASLVEPEMELVKDISVKLLGEPPVVPIDRQAVERVLTEVN